MIALATFHLTIIPPSFLNAMNTIAMAMIGLTVIAITTISATIVAMTASSARRQQSR